LKDFQLDHGCSLKVEMHRSAKLMKLEFIFYCGSRKLKGHRIAVCDENKNLEFAK